MLAVNDAVRKAARQHGVKYYEVFSRDTRHVVSRARHQAMRSLKADGWSLSAIGRALNRHHTTVLHGLDPDIKRAKRRRFRA